MSFDALFYNIQEKELQWDGAYTLRDNKEPQNSTKKQTRSRI